MKDHGLKSFGRPTEEYHAQEKPDLEEQPESAPLGIPLDDEDSL